MRRVLLFAGYFPGLVRLGPSGFVRSCFDCLGRFRHFDLSPSSSAKRLVRLLFGLGRRDVFNLSLFALFASGGPLKIKPLQAISTTRLVSDFFMFSGHKNFAIHSAERGQVE